MVPPRIHRRARPLRRRLGSAQIKVATVNLQKALADTAEIKAAEADLKTKFGPAQEQLAALEKEIAKLNQEGQANQQKYNEATMAELSARIQLKQRQLQRNSEALQDSVNRERQDILQRVGQRLQEVVKKVAEEKGIDAVLDAANTLYVKLTSTSPPTSPPPTTRPIRPRSNHKKGPYHVRVSR